MKRVASITLCVSAMAMAGGCSSVKIPDVDFFKLPENQHAQKEASYPKVGDAPKPPTGKRSDAAWDQSAMKLINQRDNFNAPESGKPLRSPEELQREFDALKAEVNAYKKDDPQ